MVRLSAMRRRILRRQTRRGARTRPVLRSTALGLRRSRLGPRQPVQYFKRTTYQTAFIQSSNLTDVFKNLTFRLQDVPNYTEFTQLYDQYCLKSVKFTLMPRYNSGEASYISVPPTWTILDYDGTFPTTNAAMLQYQNLKMKSGYGAHSRYLVPAISTEVYESPIGTAYAPKKNVFIDCNYADVPHYGATIMVPSTIGPETVTNWDIKIVYYLAFKNVR